MLNKKFSVFYFPCKYCGRKKVKIDWKIKINWKYVKNQYGNVRMFVKLYGQNGLSDNSSIKSSNKIDDIPLKSANIRDLFSIIIDFTQSFNAI